MKKSIASHKPSGLRSGFTLTELLVVILIIAVLATLALWGTKRVRDTANKSTSIRNLSQIQIANASYASDHNGKYVPIRANDQKGTPTRWFQDPDFLRNLVGEVYDSTGKQVITVPLSLLDPKVLSGRKSGYDKIYSSYGMNDTSLQLGGEPDLNSGHNLNQVTDPSRTMSFATATDFRVTYNSRYKWDFDDPNDSKTAGGEIAYRYGDRVLVAYFDGHVGEMGKSDFEQIDQNGGKANVFWKPKQ